MTVQGAAVVIEKTMSASPADFHRAMAVVESSSGPDLHHVLHLPAGTVTIAYEALPGVTLGTLLSLPQARVTITFSGVPAADRVEFMQRFELAFQRGGG